MTTNTIGTAVVYDDAYASQTHTSEGDYVTSLPTADEEKKLLDDDNVCHCTDTNDLNVGRVSHSRASHPSSIVPNYFTSIQ